VCTSFEYISHPLNSAHKSRVLSFFQVTVDQRYALIEYISHLVNNDFEAVAGDLVALGFVPPGMDDAESIASVVEPLSKVLGQLVKGGGAAKLNINQVSGHYF
jgi:aarF domain-containing kinase